MQEIKNIFVTGKPGSGKTTLVRGLIKELNLRAGGFFTAEIREAGERLGFKIIALDGKEGILSHKRMRSNFRVGSYGVNLKDLEEIGVDSIRKALRENKVVVIDEIGKMELFSEDFKRQVLHALESKNRVLGTIKLASDEFTDKIKRRNDTRVFELTPFNREEVKNSIKKILLSTMPNTQ